MNILHLNSSPRREASYSRKLGSAIVSQLQAQYPDSTLKVHDLMNPVFPQMEEVHLFSFFTHIEAHAPELTEAIRHSDIAIAELMNADAIVIEAPMYNFGITSSLKSWIDHIARASKTFSYSAAGPEGLVKGKKVYLAILRLRRHLLWGSMSSLKKLDICFAPSTKRSKTTTDKSNPFPILLA